MERQLRCYWVEGSFDSPTSRVGEVSLDDLPSGEVRIAVEYSSLNYKDALACQAHRGIIRNLPHIPGVDAAGTVLADSSGTYKVGQPVLVTGYDLGQGHWGAWCEQIRVPADWVVPLPANLSPRESMLLGTAGFTAGQSVLALRQSLVLPTESNGPDVNATGDIVVTGATGGVGSLAVQMLSRLGYTVVAVTGKPEQAEWLHSIGAAKVVSREEVLNDSKRPLASSRWAGGVDTVGGEMLTSVLRSTKYGGCVTACGLVAGDQLNMTVYPFLLRGVRLAGIASADCPYDRRLQVWNSIAGDWKPEQLESNVTEVGLEGLSEQVNKILAGKVAGRVLVRVGDRPV